MEVPLLMPRFLGKAFLSKACTNPRMQALRGRRDLLSMSTSSAWRQMEAMFSQATYLALIIQPISGRAGTSVLRRETAPLVAVFSLTHLEAARYSLAMKRGCSFRRTAVRRGSLSVKDSRNARSLMLKLRAPTVIICLPVPAGKVSGENSLIKVPHPHLL